MLESGGSSWSGVYENADECETFQMPFLYYRIFGNNRNSVFPSTRTQDMPVLILVWSVQLTGDVYPRTPKLVPVGSLREAAELLVRTFPPARGVHPSAGRPGTIVLRDKQERRVVAWVAELGPQPQTVAGAPRRSLFLPAVRDLIGNA